MKVTRKGGGGVESKTGRKREGRGEGKINLVLVVVAASGAEEEGVLGGIRANKGQTVHSPSDEYNNKEGDEEVQPESPNVGKVRLFLRVSDVGAGANDGAIS